MTLNFDAGSRIYEYLKVRKHSIRKYLAGTKMTNGSFCFIIMVILAGTCNVRSLAEQLRRKTSLNKSCQISITGNMTTATCLKVINITSVLRNLPNDIEQLIIRQNRLTVISRNVFQQFTSLKILKLEENRIRFVVSNALKGLHNLTELSLKSNDIRVIHPKVFKNNPNLVKIDLSANFIRSIKYVIDAVANLKYLKILNLDENKLLEFLHAKDMIPLNGHNLEILTIRYCLWRRIHPASFRSLQPSLKEIHVDGNYLLTDLGMSNLTHGFRNSSKLIVFSAVYCRLRTIAFLKNLANTPLVAINLSNNQFMSIATDPTPFPSLNSLKSLDMSSSGIGRIHHSAFKCCLNLTHLSLQRNSLISIPRVISLLRNLKVVLLSNQQLPLDVRRFSIPNGVFSNLWNLNTLDLSGNPIFKLRKNEFDGLMKIKKMYLSNCRITEIKEPLFAKMGSLEILDLSNNRFKLKDYTFVGLSNLISLQLRYASNSREYGNISPFVKTPKLIFLSMIGNELTNYDIELLRPLRMLKYLDLRHNKLSAWTKTRDVLQNNNLTYLRLRNNEISEVTVAMMEDFSKVRYLNLDANPFDCSLCSMTRFKTWLKKIKENKTTTKLIFGETVRCSKPNRLSGKELTEVTLNLERCRESDFTDYKMLGIAMVVSGTFGFVFAWTIYYFRWYLRYWLFRIRVKVKKYKEVTEDHNYKYDAFVSYSKEDFWWVRNHLLPNIENGENKLRLCIHERDFVIGSAICENIFNAIDNSRKTILVLTDDFLTSRWCMFELHMAQHRLFNDSRDSLVVVELKKTNPKLMTGNISYICKTRTYLEWQSSTMANKYFWTRLTEAIEKPLEQIELETIS